jgi:hypothetical protein
LKPWRLCLLLVAGVRVGLAAAGDLLVPGGALWRYLDDGSDPGTAWREPAFDDSAWRVGPAQLGYGDGDEATMVRFGASASDKFITTYFRHAFAVADPTAYTSLSLELLRDDGAVVYLNDREVFRSNLPGDAVDHRTRASAAVSGAAESAFVAALVASSNLVSGRNLLAVEVHQSATNSSDLSFDLRLIGVRPPMTVHALSLTNRETAVASTVTLEVVPLHPDGGDMEVTFYGRTGVAPPGPDFTLVAIPDTQYYVARMNGGSPEMFTAQTDWIVAHRAVRNIVFVTQLGDCVENGDNGGSNAEWLCATNALYRLENPLTTLRAHGIPYGVAVGNHDQSPGGAPQGSTTFYNQFFGEAHFLGRDYYGGHHGTNNDNHYELFSASGLDFIAIHLEFDPAANPTVLAWADGLLKTHSDRRGIVVSHWLINAGHPATFSAQGRATYEALKTNSNFFLMLCGHVPQGEGRREDTFDGHTVHSLMSDYQGRANGGDGWLRLLEFSPGNNVIRVRTYSPTLDQFETDADSQFDLPCDFQPREGFVVVGTRTGVPSGARSFAEWPALSAGVPCDWFVTISDGARTVTSPIWGFSTAPTAPEPAVPLVLNCSFDRATRRMTLNWPTRPGTVYCVVCKTSLFETRWIDLSPEITAVGSTAQWSEILPPAAPNRFYGVRIVR